MKISCSDEIETRSIRDQTSKEEVIYIKVILMIRDRENKRNTVKICEDERERERRVRGCDGRRRRIDKS